MQHSECYRLKLVRAYFETGCLCIKNGDIEMLKEGTNDREAVNYYEKSCFCSRNHLKHQ